MAVKTIIKPSEYHDSVTLMLVAKELTKLTGVQDAAVVMATDSNKSILDQAGLLTDAVKAATPNDLVIAVKAEDDAAADAALAESDKLFQKKAATESQGEYRPKSIRAAVKSNPGANVCVISVAGRYAADEAWDALRRGMHTLLFSDNVTLEDEIALKKYARDNGLLLMGAGAGTAILNGVALGFANVIPQGPVGIVSAAGTGLQETSTLLGKNGIGITQGIGTGGRDLKEEAGGIMMLEGIKALQADPATEVLLLVSKPPADSVTEKVLAQVRLSQKPTVVCFMGGDMSKVAGIANAHPARTLQEGGLKAAKLAGADLGDIDAYIAAETAQLAVQAKELRARLKPGQKYLRGLFSGGTLCYESQVIWTDMLPKPVLSNAPLKKGYQMADSLKSEGNCCVDLGEEEFTVGRPHPMIDNDLRIRRMLQEAADPEVAVIILDVVLGYGAHLDPASELGPAVRQARKIAADGGRELIVIASVTGTEEDPQGLTRQTNALKEAGLVVCPSNAAASRLTAMVIQG